MSDIQEKIPGKTSSLVELLCYRAQYQPDKTGYIFLNDGESDEIRLTYRELDRHARSVAVRLNSIGAAGERALLLYQPGLEYISAFFGCLYAGVTAVPVYPPHPARLERTLPRLKNIAKDAGPFAVMTSSSVLPMAEPFLSKDPDFGNAKWLSTDDIPADEASGWQKSSLAGDSLAFLQYTSGSTGIPKGVMVSHENLLFNLDLIHTCFDNTPESVGVIWLPPYHDMGLIGGILQPIYGGFPVVLMSPVHFLQKPFRWLDAISKYKASASGGPNFAYDLCVRKITAEQLQMIDLSSWEIAFNGSEPIRPETLEQFSEAFGICGFRREAFYPCYGLAEGTLIVSGGLKDEVPVLRDFSSDALTRKKAVLSANDAKDAHTLVGCGKSLPEQKIVIAEPDTLRECKPGETGEIWVLGKSAAQGYWHQPEKTKEVFQACIPDTGEGPFLRTGDLGFLSDGELFVTGRLKDVIILRGRNYYPQDIELTAEKSYYRLRPGCIAAFEVEINNEKRVVIAAEIERRRKERRKMTPAESGYTGKERRRSSNQRVHTELPNYDLENIKPVDTEKAITAIRKAVSEEHELEVYAVLLFKIGTIPKTSSGKIQRHACKEGFLNKTMVPVASSFLEDDYDEIERTDFPDKDRLESLSPDKRQEVLESFLQDIVSIAFKNVLTGDKVNIDDNFFDIGGDSILLVRLHNRLNEVFERDIPITAMFKHPTIKSLAQYLAQDEGKEKTFDFQYVRDRVRKQKEMLKTPNSIAIIGMAGRFPGARNIREFWENLREGKESISFFSDEELIASGVDPAMLKNPGYVRAGGILDDIDKFDAPFFDISPAEARLLDPQLRLFLECAYHTFEHAGYDPKVYPGRIGLFAGSAVNTYLMKNLMNSGLDIAKSWNNDQAIIYSDTNYLTTRTAYTLNFKGPSLSVSTACSTSLVAAHLACQSLMNYECDMALAGGAAVIVPQKEGYLYEGGTRSPDGHCRAFDEKSQGTVFTSGMGSLLLKRLDDALKHGDTVHAVIRGTAVNNDGSARAGYAAPGVDGQTEVIAKAQNIADVDPETITYIEAHGTGTTLGDPIEVEALTHVFRSVTRKKGFCAIGSVKANVGHLNMAAGVTGIIKTVLAMKHRMIPPSINFERPNPRIDFDNSPFFVNTTLSEWNPPENTPMRAGVSSFGVGGTNAHVILEQPPNPETEKKSDGSENSLFRTPVPRQHHLLALSAKTDTALEKMTANLAEYFRENPDQDTADVAYTLLTGRRKFGHRRFLVCRDADDAFLKLTGAIPSLFTGDSNYDDRSVIFMFSGQGTQYVNMGLELYQNEPIFRGQVDLCSELLGPHMDFDIRDIMYPGERREAINHQSSIINRQSTIINRQSSIINHQSSIINHQSSIINHQSPIINHQSPIANHQSSIVNHQSINHTAIAQPALFVIEYSLARLWMAWGIRPRAMIGHSIGEYVAACLAGVLTLEDALSLVAYRGKMMGDLPQGGMLAVPLSEEDIRSFLKPGVSLAVINAPSLCVVSGYTEAVDEVKKSLDQKGIQSRRLHTSHAFHSEMTEPVLKPFTEHVRNIQLRPPRIPCISNVTGTWISDEDATDPEYWARHLRQTVRFSDGIRTLTEESDDALLEVGPGQTLTSLAMRQANSKEQSSVVLNSIRHPQDNQSDQIFLMTTLGKLWLAGVKPDWTAFYAQERRRRIPLPEYPFEGRRYWVEPKRQGQIQEAGIRRSDMADWFYAPSWKRVPLSGSAVSGQWSADHPVLIFSDTYGLGEQVSKELKQNGQDVIVVKKGSGFENLNPANFIVNPERPEDYETLVTQLRASGKFPEIILFMWGIGNGQEESKGKSLTEKVDDIIRTGFNGFRFLTQSLGNREQTANIIVVSDNVQEVTGTEELHPEKAMLPGLVRGLPKVCPTLRSRSIDLEEVQNLQFCASQLVSEIRFGASDPVVAYRGPHRWVHSFEPIRLEPVKAKFRQGGTYLITEGLGEIGYSFAEYLARNFQSKLALVESPSSDHYRPLAIDMGTESAFIREQESALEKSSDIKEIRSYDGLQETIDELCSSYVFDYFRICGIEAEKGRKYTREELSGQLNILPKFEKFLDFFIRVLSEDGIIRTEDDFIQFLKSGDEVRDSEALAREAETRYPDFKEMSQFLNHCVHHYPEALSGKIEAISVLFPDGKSDRVKNFAKNMADHSNSQVCMDLLRDMTLMISEKSGKKIRILEVGAGTGDLTWKMASALAGQDVEYYFTDIGKSFVVKAERDAAKKGFNFMKCGVLDISSDPAAQGYDTRSFDMIFGLNVVHATKRISETLGHLKTLLVPGGIIALTESIKQSRPVDMVWGVAEGWWYFEDEEIRTETPLMEAEKWEQVMREIGLENVQGYPANQTRRSQADLALITAQVPQSSDSAKDRQKYTLAPSKASRAKTLEKLGSDVLPLCADITDPEQTRSAIRQINEKFGDIHGIIHAYGTGKPDTFSKVRSALVLDVLFRGQNPDFLAFCSSLSPATGQDNLGDWAENAFLDAFACYRNTTNAAGLRTLSVNRNRWSPEGEDLMTDKENPESFCRALFNGSSPQIIISPYDFRKADEFQVKNEEKRDAGQESEESLSAQPRPDLGNTYAAPGTETEKKLVSMWQEVLGIEQVGTNDNFFELGGDSLIATQVISRVRDAFQVEVSPENLFKNPTVAGIAEQVEILRWAMNEASEARADEELEEGEI